MRYVVTIFAIFILIFLGIIIFGRDSGPKVLPKPLADYSSTGVDMRLTTSGEINGEDAHREVVITVGNDRRTIEIIQGYEGNVIKSESYANNDSAYSAFLSALDVANYTRIRKSKVATEAGQCPLGNRYVYEIINNGNDDMRSWSTSCGGQATFGGNGSLVRRLFQNQITNYNKFVENVDI